MSTDTKGAKILARTFFNQLKGQGYTSHQIIGVATELIDLVTTNLKDSAAARTDLQPGANGQEIQHRPL